MSKKDKGRQAVDRSHHNGRVLSQRKGSTTTSIEYDTAVEDLVDLLHSTIERFQLFPPHANAETTRCITVDAMSCVLSEDTVTQSAQGE
jgi:hypothetical protein